LEELLAAARTRGFDPSERLLKDWVERGLLDQALRRGRGRGKGIERTWSENQKELWLLLLSKRDEAKRIASLCNIPVLLWLDSGDDYVPLRQARRALLTWVGTGVVSWRRATATAEQLVSQFAHQDARPAARKRLVEELAKIAYGGVFRRDRVLDFFRRAYDPTGLDRNVGPKWMNFNAESFVLITEVRLHAVKALQAGTASDQAFEWARAEYRVSRAEYDRLEPTLATDPEASRLFLTERPSGLMVPSTLQQRFNTACLDLLTLLGFSTRDH
jgi:hypothetical protein